jgi:hypothetical protein
MELNKVLSGTLDVINLRSTQIVSNEIDKIENMALVREVCEGAQPGKPASGTKEVKFTQHCEITLTLHMLNRTQPKLTKSRIEIGVSKACCEWCCDYLRLLAMQYPRYSILVRASHGKQPDCWMMPPNGPKPLEQPMAQSIEDKLDGVVWKIRNRRRSDSNELAPFSKEANVEDDISKIRVSLKH